jgi:hypothetical protein
VRATIDGHPYAIAADENGATRDTRQDCQNGTSPFGFLHVVDLTDPTHPAVVSRISLETDQPENCAHMASQGGLTSELAFSSHYCAVDDPEHTTAVACTWMGSGLRVFDVRDVRHPREIAYYVPPGRPEVARGALLHGAIIATPNLDAAGSPVRWKRTPNGWELWFASTQNGFQIVRLDRDAYPLATTSPASTRAACRSRRTIAFTLPRGARGVRLLVDGRSRTLPRRGRALVLSLAGLPRRTVTVRLSARVHRRRYVRTSLLHPCVAR